MWTLLSADSARPPPPGCEPVPGGGPRLRGRSRLRLDRKSTRLNSSHANISYAVFCLKKKNSFGAKADCGDREARRGVILQRTARSGLTARTARGGPGVS